MKTAGKKKRIETIDVAKAISIFLVILGHTTENLDTPMFRRMLYTFHMPLFFFLAGLSIKPKALAVVKEWGIFLKKNFLALIVPYLIWGLIYAPFSYSNFLHLAYGSWESLTAMETLTSLWYLPCLFISRVIVQLIIDITARVKKCKTELICGICAIPLFVAGVLLPHPEEGIFWCTDISLVGAAFILSGIALKRMFLVLAQQKARWLALLLLGSVMLFCFGTVFRGDNLELSLMCKGTYGSLLWFVLNSASGSLAVLVLSMLICRASRESLFPFHTSVFTSVGVRTMGIYLLHKPFLQQILIPGLSKIFGASCPFLLTAFLASVLALLFSLALCCIIEKFIPQLLGQFPPNEWSEKAESTAEKV